jgi:O-antigen/teichoic acid export membrane protein
MQQRGGLQRVVRQTAVYAIGNVAVKASGLILAPLYLNTDLLPREAYGHLVLLEAAAQITIPIAGMGMATGMLKFMSEAEEDPAIPFTTLLLTLAAAIVAFAILWVSAGPLAAFLLDDPARTLLPRMMAAYAALKVVSTVPYMLLRVRERAGWYAASTAAEWAILVGGVYYLLGVREMSLDGVLVAYVTSAGAGAAVMTGFMLSRIPWRFEGRLVRNLLRFGIPLVLSSFAGLFLNVGDRFILKLFTDAEVVGIYGWAARLGGVINMLIVQSFQLAFLVIGLKTVGTGDRSLHRRTFRHYTIWTGWAVLGLSLLAYDLTLMLVQVFDVDPHYLDAHTMVLPVALGFMGYGLYIVVNNVLYATEMTHVISINVVIAAITNAVLNVLMIPSLGAYGAALATALSYALLAGLSAWIAERRIWIGYSWKTVAVVLAVVVALYAIGHMTTPWPALPRVSARLGLLVLYVPLIWWAGLYTKVDLEKARDLVRDHLRRG